MRKVITLTTIPPRLPHLEQTLTSLDRQNVDAVYLNLPDFCDKTQSAYQLPNWLMGKPWQRLVLNHCNNDYGPATKIIPTLKIETQANTQILICDDDHVYEDRWSEDYFDNMLPGQYVCGNGANTSCIEADLIAKHELDNEATDKLNLLFKDQHYNFPEAFSGLLVQRSSLNPQRILELTRLQRECYYADDLVIGKVLAENNTRMHHLGLETVKMRSMHDYQKPEWSLAAGLTGGNHQTYMKALPAIFGLQEETNIILRSSRCQTS